MALSDDLSKLYPSKYAFSYCRNSVVIHETSPSAKVKSVEWQNSCFHTLDCSQIHDWKDLFSSNIDILQYDCDGIIIFEENGKKYMFLNELKSKFDSTDIYHAKKQILSSYIKANMMLNISQCYEKEGMIVKGFIYSWPADKNYLRDLHKELNCKPNSKYKIDAEFTDSLCNVSSKRMSITPADCFELRNLPIHNRVLFVNMEFYHVEIPQGKDCITLDVHKYI